MPNLMTQHKTQVGKFATIFDQPPIDLQAPRRRLRQGGDVLQLVEPLHLRGVVVPLGRVRKNITLA